jgi:hypothetical protein
MVVYNNNASLPDGAGLYAWNGSEWKSMSAGNANSCVPVTATTTSEKAGNNAQITVTITAGNPTFGYVWTKDGNPVRTTTNVNTASDSYTTVGEGIYTVSVANPCMATPVSFTFEVAANGETLTDNGNGTKTDSQGNLIYNGETYSPVKSDVPGIYLKDGEIVYTGADGIPGNEDDDVFVVPDYPLPIQETLFSMKYPVVIHQDDECQMELDFADGRIYKGTDQSTTYTGKIKFMSSNSDVLSVDETGFIKVGSIATPVSITIILEDGSISSLGINIRSKSFGNSNKLAGLRNADATLFEGSIGKIGVSIVSVAGDVNAHNTKTLTYSIEAGGDEDNTGSTVTSGGWFTAGTPGVVTVTATATDDVGTEFTGEIIVIVLGTPEEELTYETASTHWATLDPAPAYAGGNGTEADPYRISSVRQFKKLSTDIALSGSTDVTYQKYFELTTDLDFSADETVKSTLIGTFYGTFDGKGHVIRNLHIDASGKTGVSLFGGLSYGEIKNLGREGGSTTGIAANNIGGLVVSISRGGKLSNCYNSSSINATDATFNVGGLVYMLSDGATIRNCYNTGEIIASGNQNGGLAATTLYQGGTATIINSYNTGNVNGSNANGGLFGTVNASDGYKQILNLTNSFNFGNITNNDNDNRIGSLIGVIIESNSALMEINATNVYYGPDVVSIVNGEIKSNQPIGWNTSARETLKDAILAVNPTMGEDGKYIDEYSKSSAFATELGSAFKYTPGRTPKLAWEK